MNHVITAAAPTEIHTLDGYWSAVGTIGGLILLGVAVLAGIVAMFAYAMGRDMPNVGSVALLGFLCGPLALGMSAWTTSVHNDDLRNTARVTQIEDRFDVSLRSVARLHVPRIPTDPRDIANVTAVVDGVARECNLFLEDGEYSMSCDLGGTIKALHPR